MPLIHHPDDLHAALALVPTMGALHEGHLVLIRHARSLGHRVVVSVFVNPTQFGPGEDYDRYPRTLETDTKAAMDAGATFVFAPSVETVYPHDTPLDTPPLPAVASTPGLEDASRPGHLAGVCQVVARLFDLTRPAVAVFGEKDYQQLLTIRAMVAASPMRWPGLAIVAHPTVRDPDGLAMSSRNRYLTSIERPRALALFQAINAAAAETRTPAQAEGAMAAVLARHVLDVDYAVVRDAETLAPIKDLTRPARALIAARLGAIRIIDNGPVPARLEVMTITAAATTLASIDPATGDIVGEVPITHAPEIDRIVARARDAQASWANLGPERRANTLRPAGDALANDADEIGGLLSREMGKPLKEAIGEARYCGEGLSKTVDAIATALAPERFEDEHTVSTVHHDPFGVCAAITPWNFPLAMPHSLVIPALMAGNSVVLKPSEESPLVGQAYVDRLNRSLPAGVLQIVHGADEQGRALVASDVDLIAFTGSREVGKAILGAASGGLKRVILELGGKDPLIVLDSANLDAAARFAVQNSFRNAGQVCVSTERIYVDESIADAFELRVAALTAEQKLGRGLDADVTVGPMINARQRDHVVAQVDDAVRGGAKVIAGGDAAEGNFVAPTVLTNVTHDMAIMCEETFGPVACIMRFRSPDEAVQLANDTPFGLGATVFGDPREAEEVARRLSAGMIGVNKSCGGASGTPWVGARESGYGYHGGREGHRQFSQARVVSLEK